MSKKFSFFTEEHKLIIPDYQRAYSWGEKQLIPFINDIIEHCENDKSYYLGHFILENSTKDDIYEIIDGQQRITTIYLFMLVCGYFKKCSHTKKFNFSPTSYDINSLKEIENILGKPNVNDDELKGLQQKFEYLSSKKMIDAVLLFKNYFDKNELKKECIDKYINIIHNAYCSSAVYSDKSVATQIFELHNTRGLKLTETEKIKALLMKNIYINSNENEADKNVKEVQKYFSEIFKFEEKANEIWFRGELPLDSILMYHLRAIEDGNKKREFNSPNAIEGENGSFEFIKKRITEKQKISKEEVIKYVRNIAEQFRNTLEIITEKIIKDDGINPIIGDVLLLDKDRSLIFLLRAYRVNEVIDFNLIKRWENFLLNYEIINFGGFFYNINYSNRGKYDIIFESLVDNGSFDLTKNIIKEYYDGSKKFGANWKALKAIYEDRLTQIENYWLRNAYGWNKIGYFLYKYETYNGSDYRMIREKVFKDNKVSIDHIVAKGISWENLGYKRSNDLPEEAEDLRNNINDVINGIGNLSLSTSGHNASDSNDLPSEHIHTYRNLGLDKTVKHVEEWSDPQIFADNINERSKNIIEYIKKNIIEDKDGIWK